MVIQHAADQSHLKFFTQHDHGLISGELAHAWQPRLGMPLVMLIALHDLAWQEIDQLDVLEPDAIPFDAERGLLHDFLTLPSTLKVPVYARGITQAEAIHPYAGLLLSLHYTAFLDAQVYGALAHEEAARRERLAASLGFASPHAPSILEDYERLKFFDLISLFICLRHPEADPQHAPRWITPALKLLGTSFTLAWRDHSTLTLDPFPCAAPCDLTLPYRRMDATRFADAHEQREAWRAAPQEQLVITVTHPDGP